ncbi:MAG: hydrogenase maturation protease [Planctomycetota bacterium]|jgi:hydrogenase maturation protease
MSNVIIGVGNTILSDDGIGIYIAEKLKKELNDVEVQTTSSSGLNLIDYILGYQKAIFIDSVKTETGRLGQTNVYNMDDFENNMPFSIHTTDLINAIKICRKCEMNVPEQIFFIGIEIKDNSTFTEHFSREIDLMKDRIHKKVREKIHSIMKGHYNEPRRHYGKN